MNLKYAIASIVTCFTLISSTVHAQDNESPNLAPPPGQVAPMPPPVPYYTPPIAPAPPPRGHYALKPRYGLMTAGLIIFGASYLPGAIGGYIADSGWFAVPIAGPLIWAGKNLDQDESFDRAATVGLVIYSLVQVTGISMAIAGAVTKTRVFVKDQVSAQITPLTFNRGGGLGVVGRF